MMSHLSLPRIHFLGKFKVNPATANNIPVLVDSQNVRVDVVNYVSAYPQIFGGAQPNLNGFDITQPVLPASPTQQEFTQWRQQHVRWRRGVRRLLGGLDDATPLAGAPGVPPIPPVPPVHRPPLGRNWNYLGDHSVSFEQTTVTAVELPNGEFITDSTRDSLIGASVELLGSKRLDRRSRAVMIDLHPLSGFTSQLYSGLIRLAKDDKSLMEGDLPKRSHAIWVNFWRNLIFEGDTGASAVWQIGLPKQSLDFSSAALPTSAALSVLQEGASAGQGLVVRFCTYQIGSREDAPNTNLTPEQWEQEAPKLRRDHPAYLVLVGTIGCWEEGEVASTPKGRLLYQNPQLRLDIPPELQSRRQSPRFWLAPALAQVDHQRKVVTLDLVNTIPEANFVNTLTSQPTDVPEKFNMGTLTLCLRHFADGVAKIVPIGSLPFSRYNRAAYLERMGIVELPYPDDLNEELMASGDLLLVQGDLTLPDSATIMTEQPTNVNFENHNIVLEVGDKTEFTLELLARGAHPAKPAAVSLSLESVVPPPVTDDPRNEATIMGMVKLPDSVEAGADGKVTFEIEALSAGICKILFSAEGVLPVPINDSRLAHLLQFYIYVRVLPKDEFPEEVITNEFLRDNWQFVYDNLFVYYDILFPSMSRIIDFSNPASVRANATLIKVFTDPNGMDNTLYMPISRDMSRGKRQLLFRWCSLAESGVV